MPLSSGALASARADFDVAGSRQGRMQHFCDVGRYLPGLCEKLLTLPVHGGRALVLADMVVAVGQVCYHGPVDLPLGHERLPVVDVDPHVEGEAVGNVLEQHLGIVRAQVDRRIPARATG